MKYFEFLKNYEGEVKINGKKYTPEELENFDEDIEDIDIELIPKSRLKPIKYRIYVKGWMYNNSGNLDFHRRWNDGIPMPSKMIDCYIIGETPGMFKVDGICDNNEHWKGYISKAAIIEKIELGEM